MIVQLLLVVVAVAAAAAVSPASSEVAAGERRPPSLVPFMPPGQQHGGGRQQPLFDGRAAGGCMPRGFRVPPSAPSRYANYHTLDAGGVCNDGGRGWKP